MLKIKKEKTMFNLKKESKMKNLKVMMMTLMMCLMTMVSFGQITYSYENDVLTTTQETGTRVEKDDVFRGYFKKLSLTVANMRSKFFL